MVFNSVSWLTPLLPADHRKRLEALAASLIRETAALGATLPKESRRPIIELLRPMNSYYTHFIEGHRTHPKDIERALRNDYSGDPERRASQQYALAHIDVQRELENRLERETVDVASPEFLLWLHEEFYRRVPIALRTMKDEHGREMPMTPGRLRTSNVQVGKHTPPAPATLEAFLHRFAEAYSLARLSPLERVIAIASAHHRLAWIHPFPDGNGRVARLFSHAMIIGAEVGGAGLWSVIRGLARNREKYFQALEWADEPRQGDLDGRGSLTDRGLEAFCHMFLEVALDQVLFMKDLLQLDSLESRIERHIQRRSSERAVRQETFLLLREVLRRGTVPRGDADRATGLGERAARQVVSAAVRDGYLSSDTPKGALRFAVPSAAFEDYFPTLYPERTLSERS